MQSTPSNPKNYAFNIIKSILEEQDLISFTVDEKNNAFINNQFDAPIVLAVGNRYKRETKNGALHLHRIIRDHDVESMDMFRTCIDDILDYIFHNLFSPIDFIHVTRTEVILQKASSTEYYKVKREQGLFIKTLLRQVRYEGNHRYAYKRFSESGETFNLDFTDLEQQAASFPARQEYGNENMRPACDDYTYLDNGYPVYDFYEGCECDLDE